MERLATLLALLLALIVFSIIADQAYDQHVKSSQQAPIGHAAEAKMADHA